jgi:hypothetical protein
LICRFCSQWNPERAARCCFCQNRLDAAEDRTASGRLSAAHQGLARLPGESTAPSPPVNVWLAGEAGLPSDDQTGAGVLTIWKVVVGVFVGLWLLWMLKCVCR